MVSIVSPFHNEQHNVDVFLDRLTQVLESVEGETFEIICIDDGSIDSTLSELVKHQRRDGRIRVIELSRNFGKEAAVTAGIDAAVGDAVIPIDSDLQDPPELIPDLIQKWRSGFEVVLAKRVDRSSDTFLKRTTAKTFYKVHNKLSEFHIPENVGDFRLMDRAVVDAVKAMGERRRFMKGIFAWVGFRTATVEYVRERRHGGSSSFNSWKLWNFAIEGITSFSTVPLRVWTYLGTLAAALALFYAAYIVTRTLIFGTDMPGYASLITAILFMGGVQLIGIGVVGEYIGRIYNEVKARPIYIVRNIYEATKVHNLQIADDQSVSAHVDYTRSRSNDLGDLNSAKAKTRSAG